MSEFIQRVALEQLSPSERNDGHIGLVGMRYTYTAVAAFSFYNAPTKAHVLLVCQELGNPPFQNIDDISLAFNQFEHQAAIRPAIPPILLWKVVQELYEPIVEVDTQGELSLSFPPKIISVPTLGFRVWSADRFSQLTLRTQYT